MNFKFKDWVFTRLLPYRFKLEDTYKDRDPNKSNKGILERFVDTCMQYFDDEVVPNIEEALNLIDVDCAVIKKDDNGLIINSEREMVNWICLNYLWEYFGCIPLAYGILIKKDSYSLEDLRTWLSEKLNQFPNVDSRRVLKYAISLYKIRGTNQFYTLLGRLYGVNFIISEILNPEEEYDPSDGTKWDGDQNLLIASYPWQSIDEYPPEGLPPESDYRDPNNTKQPYYPESINAKDWPGFNDLRGKPFIPTVEDDNYALVISGYRGNVRAGWPYRNCNSCTTIKVNIQVPVGIWDSIILDKDIVVDNPDMGVELDTDQLTQKGKDLEQFFYKLFDKYLPVNVKIGLPFKWAPSNDSGDFNIDYNNDFLITWSN